MDPIVSIDELRAHGRMTWIGPAHAWMAEPDEVVGALSREGFEEVKHEVTRVPRRHPTGGVWQGLNPRTGAVASAVWARPAEMEHPLLFLDIDGNPLTG